MGGRQIIGTVLRLLMILVVIIVVLLVFSLDDEREVVRNEDVAAEAVSNKVTLTFVYSGTRGVFTAKSTLTKIVDNFMSENPHIELRLEASGTRSYLDYLQMKDAMDEFPDIMEMPHAQIYADAGRIARLPDELTALVEHPVELDGAVYALPLTATVPSGFLYNKEIFQQAGIVREPQNWEEFLQACEKIQRLGIAPLSVGGKDAANIGPLLNKLVMDHVLADDPNWNAAKTRGMRSFSNSNFIAALLDLAELFKKGYIHEDWLSTSNNQTITQLLSRKAAMIYTNPTMIQSILEADPYFKIGFFMPRDRNGRLVLDTLPRPSGIAISTEAAADSEKLAAFEAFIRYFYSSENYRIYLDDKALPATVNTVEQILSEPMSKAMSIVEKPHVKSMPMDAFWGENAMPPGFDAWFYKQIRQWLATGTPPIEQLMNEADEEWGRLHAIMEEYTYNET